MKNRIVIFMLAAMIAAAPITAYAADADLEARVAALEKRVAALEAQLSGSAPEETPGETPGEADQAAPSDMSISEDGVTLTYTSHKVAKDYEGNDCVILYFDFINESDENKSPLSSTMFRVFQHGKEIDMAVVMDDTAVHDRMTTIMPGADPLPFGVAYGITDLTDITVDAYIIGHDPIEFTLSLE